jgi:hypothetical protein
VKPISARSEAALREAAMRLLAGKPQVTDRRLTVVNLAREAGVGRSTANRATELLTWFRSEIPGEIVAPPALIEQGRCTQDVTEISTLKETAQRLAQQVQHLSMRDAEQRRMIDALRLALEEATHGRVVSFPTER